MKCAVHTEVEASGYCRNCGKALCGECTRDVHGIHYCEDCLAGIVAKPTPAPGGPNPALAAVLGLLPGLGAVYNGEYMKALLHVLIFGGLISLIAGDHVRGYEPLFGMMIPAAIVYFAVDSYRVAQSRLTAGAATAPAETAEPGQPVGAYLIIGIGVLLLLNNLEVLSIGRLLRFWPAALIIIGILMLRQRIQGPKT